jgi:Skp family chaperone for outer membrane proteins
MLLGSASSRAGEPGLETPGSPESAEVLAAQLEIKKAYVKASEVALAAAKAKGSKRDVEMAAAQLDVRKTELQVVESQLKNANARPPLEAESPQEIAVFNMAAVMRKYENAKYAIYQLTKLKSEKSGKLMRIREEHIKRQTQLPTITDAAKKDQIQRELLELQREFEDEERFVNKLLNDGATKIIVKIYDEINEVVDETAKANGYRIIFAYPDAVTAEEKENTALKELKLRPSAALPFFVARQANVTDVIIQKLNTKFPPLDKNGKKVDVNNLPPIPTPEAAGKTKD